MKFTLPISCLVATAAVAQPLPEKALKYHEALLKRPHNAALFDRLFGAWIDEQPVEALGTFLEKQAADNGGANWTVLAAYQLRRGNEDAALASLAKAIAAQPDDLALPMERGKLRLRRLELAAAREDFARVAAGPDEALALEAAKLTGKAWLREGKPAEAVKSWDAVLAAHPGDEDLLEDLVETAAAESEIPQALIYAEKLIAASHDPYQKTLRQLRRADLLTRAGRDDDAVEACVATLAQVGDGSWLEREVLAQIDKIFRKQDRVADLATRLKSLAETYPQRLAIHRQLAKLEAAQGETDAAIGRFREVLKRSPGERELREEFVRLLTDAERFDDAAAELEKLIEAAPTDANLLFQLAALRSRQNQSDAVAAALEKARTLLGGDESAGLRVAGLLLQYGLAEKGEALLKSLAAAPAASPAALEALAGHYGRTARKDQAIKLLQKVAAAGELDGLLRAAGSISALGESAAALETLSARAAQFPAEPRFLAAFAQAALAAAKPADAVPPALKLVRLATQPTDLAEAISLATRATTAAEKSFETREALATQPIRTPSETCFLAALAEGAGDFEAVGKLLETNVDQLVIRFHAALLDRRGDADAAIAVLTRLADTPEGKKAAYFKDLSELQQRAGKNAAAQATVDRWKLAAPGDKSAWIAASRLLRETGKLDDAVRTLRQAVGRFEGDTDLAASLAALHTESGQTADAEAIYWKLYDDAQTPGDQARWAAQLAQLAQRTATTAALEEKLRDRARTNRRALGPILALAELARVTEDPERELELLGEASRLKPDDLDLTLRLATLAEKSGDYPLAAETLESTLAKDRDGRVRQALTDFYFRTGEVEKAMASMKMAHNGASFDPRVAEKLAMARGDQNRVYEAIEFLQTELPGGGDWRSRYLLATLLVTDGRTEEAEKLFFALLQAGGDLPGIVPSAGQLAQVDRAVAELLEWRNAFGDPIPLFQILRRQVRMPLFRTPADRLPVSPDDLHRRVVVQLWKMSLDPAGNVDPALAPRLRAAGILDADFIVDFLATLAKPEGEQDFAELLEKHPAQPGLLELLTDLSLGLDMSETVKPELMRKLLQREPALPPLIRFRLAARLVPLDVTADPMWDALLGSAREALASQSAGQPTFITNVLLNWLTGHLPDGRRAEIGQILRDDLAAASRLDPALAHGMYPLTVLTWAGTQDEWLAEANRSVREYQRKPHAGEADLRIRQFMQGYRRSYRAGWQQSTGPADQVFRAPELDTVPLISLPPELRQMVSQAWNNPMATVAIVTRADLERRAGEIESPALRAWLALTTGNQADVDAALAVEPPAVEAGDFHLLRAVDFVRRDRLGEAWDALLQARSAAAGDPAWVAAVNVALISTAELMKPEARANYAEPLQAAFLQCYKHFGQSGVASLAGEAVNLGFETLARRMVPAPAAPRATPRVSQRNFNIPTVLRRPPPDRIAELVEKKKYRAAAMEVWQQGRSDSDYFQNANQSGVRKALGEEGRAELLRLADPGETQSLTRRIAYADVCDWLGKSDLAADALEAILKQQPGNRAIAMRLLFALGPAKAERKLELQQKAATFSDFPEEVGKYLEAARFNDSEVEGFFATVANWLEVADPSSLAQAKLEWVSHYAKRWCMGDFNLGTPSIFVTVKRNLPEDVAHFAGCERLARAMLRHGAIAEEGFRLLSAGNAWVIPSAELDALARQTWLATTAAGARGGYFSFNDGSRKGGVATLTMAEHSSGTWLRQRLAATTDPATVFPPDFVAEITAHDAKVGGLVARLARPLEEADLAALWSGTVGSDVRISGQIRLVAIQKIADAPGAGKFFAKEIADLAPGAVGRREGTDDTDFETIFAIAVVRAGPGEIDAVARACCRAVFDGKPLIAPGETLANREPQVDFMGNVARRLLGDPAAMVRCQVAFQRIGVPLGTSDEPSFRSFRSKRVTTVDEAERFFDSLGWLAGIATWEPYLGVIQRRKGKDATIETTLPLAYAARTVDGISDVRDELVVRLAARQNDRFGALMTAAALSSGGERTRFTSQAFQEAAAEIATLPADRAERFAMLRSWLDERTRIQIFGK